MARNSSARKGQYRNRSHSVAVEQQPGCVLDNPHIGIVSENDHRVGLCLCYMCSCNKHKCSYSQSRGPPTASAMVSRYSQDYRYSGFNKPKSPTSFFRPSIPTTATPSSVAPVAIPRPVKRELRSQYQQEFPNWGPHEYFRMKNNDPQLRLYELPFKGASNYKETYKTALKRDRPNFALFTALDSTIAIGPNEPVPVETTYDTHMKGSKPSGMNRRVKRNPESYRKSTCSPKHFSTTFGRSYHDGVAVSMEPHLLRALHRPRRKY